MAHPTDRSLNFARILCGDFEPLDDYGGTHAAIACCALWIPRLPAGGVACSAVAAWGRAGCRDLEGERSQLPFREHRWSGQLRVRAFPFREFVGLVKGGSPRIREKGMPGREMKLRTGSRLAQRLRALCVLPQSSPGRRVASIRVNGHPKCGTSTPAPAPHSQLPSLSGKTGL
jgi:hypothetical protein